MNSHEEICGAYFAHLQSYLPFSEETQRLLATIITTGVVKKGGLTLTEGKVCNHIDFIHKGVVRVFSNKDGFEITSGIFLENRCVMNMKSLTTKSPSTVSIQALEEVSYGRIMAKDL